MTKFGRQSMEEIALGEKARLAQIQRAANSAPNANLFPDGTLDPK